MEVEDTSSLPTEDKQPESGSVTVSPPAEKAGESTGSVAKVEEEESDSDARQLAAAQGTSSVFVSYTMLVIYREQVEFYFGDSNLPFDK